MILLDRYRNFIEATDSNPFDFLPKVEEIYFDFINESEKEKLKVIGKNKSGCLICAYGEQDALEAASVVWLDSERSPSGIFSDDLEMFFSLLPYGMGYLYTIISNAIDINNNLINSADCNKLKDEHRQILKSNAVAEILPVYEKTMKISAGKEPCVSISNSIRKHWSITERIIKK